MPLLTQESLFQPESTAGLPQLTIRAIRVILTEHEMAQAVSTGSLREIRARLRHQPDQHGFSGDPFDVHIEGAGAEIATGKVLDVYVEPRIDVFNTEADLGTSVNVRRRGRDEYDALIRRSDNPNYYHVHVSGRMPYYTVWGWLDSAECRKHPEWRQTYGGREEAWFVPKQFLRDIRELRMILREDY